MLLNTKLVMLITINYSYPVLLRDCGLLTFIGIMEQLNLDNMINLKFTI